MIVTRTFLSSFGFGPLGVGHGLGISFAVADLNGNGRLDVIAPGKDGLVIYYNEGDAGLEEMPFKSIGS